MPDLPLKNVKKNMQQFLPRVILIRSLGAESFCDEYTVHSTVDADPCLLSLDLIQVSHAS